MTLRAAVTYPAAVKECGADGMRLPTLDELEGLRLDGVLVGVPPNNYEMSSSVDTPGFVLGTDPSGNRISVGYADPRPYRCLGSPTNVG
jgi:hypothetical protein